MTKIKDLQKIELAREKFQKYGPQKLRDYEILAIILGVELTDHMILSKSGHFSFQQKHLL